MNYEKAYYRLFNSITDAIKLLEKSFAVTPELLQGIEVLKSAQEKTENMFVDNDD